MAATSLEGLELLILPYGYDELEPMIDQETMVVHHTKHHRSYTDNTNAAFKMLSGNPEVSSQLRTLATRALKNDNSVVPLALHLAVQEEKSAPSFATKKQLRSLRNNGGGFVNHNEYFLNLMPQKFGGGQVPESGLFILAIQNKFGSFQAFKEKFIEEAMGVFGSGWAWLVLKTDGTLDIVTSPNQDRPSIEDQIILACDVWEHAYYLKRQNRRKEYLIAFWDVVNYKVLEQRYLRVIEAQSGLSNNL